MQVHWQNGPNPNSARCLHPHAKQITADKTLVTCKRCLRRIRDSERMQELLTGRELTYLPGQTLWQVVAGEDNEET